MISKNLLKGGFVALFYLVVVVETAFFCPGSSSLDSSALLNGYLEHFWPSSGDPRGGGRTEPGYSTVLWSEALEPSGWVIWRPNLMRFDAITPYLSMSK